MKTDTLINALVKAQQEINHVVQDAENPFFKSDFATLKQVFDTVKKPMNDNGIYIQQVVKPMDGGVMVETIFYGHGGEVSSGDLPVPAIKHDPQAYGSSLSYAKRYSLLLACGIATKKEDDDGERATDRTPYILLSQDKKEPLAETTSPMVFLDNCRKYLRDNESEVSQTIFKESFSSIQRAYEEATGSTKQSFKQLIDLYNGKE